MLSVGNRDGRKRMIGLGLEMEETELEEGEALSYQNEAQDSTIDPDIALSYIGEKLENVLGHFQKDFEGGVSYENLGAKFGGYGSFLPSHQRSPSWSHTRSPAEAQYHDSPRKLHLEDKKQNSFASSSASPLTRTRAAPGKALSVGNSSKSNNSFLNFKHAEESNLKSGGVKKPVINTSDQRTLKVRIKVGSENLPTQKNADIYSGLGLVVSPSSSLDDSPTTSEGQFCNLEPEASPTSILQIMTSCPGELLLSPLSEDLINLLEKRKPKGKEAKPAEKIKQKKTKPSGKNEVLSVELTNQKNNGITDINASLLKEKESELDTLGCEELVSNALKLPLLLGSQNTFFDPAKDSRPTATYSLNGNFNNESAQDNSAHGKISENKKGNHVGNMPVKPLALDQTESVVSKGRKEEGVKPTPEKSSTGGKRKQKVPQSIGYQGAHLPKNDSRDYHKYNEKPVDKYKDLFGDAEFEDEDKESISGDRKSPQIVGKRSSSEDHNLPREKFDGKASEKPQVPENHHGLASQSAPPPLGYGPGSEAPIGSVPLVKEDWVECDKCRKWRLLPLGTNLKSLPDKWLCRMLTWLPGMNRCIVPQEETTNALRALYHPAPLIPGPTSEFQPSQLNNNTVGNPVQVAPVDDRYPGQENFNISLQTPTISGKKKSTKAAISTDHDGSTNSSNSHKKNLGISSNKISNLNSGKNSPSVSASGYQNIRQSSSAVEKYADPKKEKSSFANSSDKGENLKIRTKREADMDGSRSSKRMKSEELRFDDDNWASDNGGTSSKAGRVSTSLSNNTSGNDRHNYTSHKDLTESKKDIHVLGTSDKGLYFSEKHEDKDSERKRKSRETCESDHQKEKKVRVSKSAGKDSNGTVKASVGPTIKSLSDKDEHNNNVQYHSNNTLAADYLKSDMGSVNPSVAANSSSSKVSGSHKNKTNGQEVKEGSPVESVSSSPLKYSNTDKAKKLVGKEDFHDSGSLNSVSTKGLSHKDERDIVKKEVAPATEIPDDKKYAVKNSSEKCKAEEKTSTDQSQKKKSGKGLSSHSKGKSRAYGSDVDKVHNSSHDSLDLEHLYEEKSKSRRNKSEEKSGTPSKGEKFIGGTSSESSKGKSQKKPGHNGKDVIKSQDKKHRIHEDHDSENLPKKVNQVENNGSGKSHSLPPLARIPAEPVSGSQKENGMKSSAIETLDNSDAQKAQNSRKKSENLNGQPIRHPTPNSHKARDLDAPSPVQRDSSSHAANSALKEAKDLKHLADRLKNSGSTDSNGFYFQAALKFLHGASLLESGSSEGTKHNDLMHSMHIYGSTAKLCEFCAREYEKSKDMAAAALAYKCMEVAYMRVVYSSHANASRDRNELQTALQIVPPGESPSSSASDVDNLNHQTTTDKVALAKVVGSPQVSGSHAITSRNRSGFLRILNFAQDVNCAMEASRKSRIALSAATARLGETSHKESISSLKKALDFNFQDVDVLLRLVRIAMETISR